jgi:hypothetical protein
MKRIASLLASWSVAALAFGHSAPSSLVRFDFLPHSVRAQLMVPVSELEFATAAEQPAATFEAYLLRHLAAEAPDGARWEIAIQTVRATTYFDHDYLMAEIVMTPPPGATAGRFIFIDDAVTHEVRNHVVMLVANGAGEPRFLGLLQHPARRLLIERAH